MDDFARRNPGLVDELENEVVGRLQSEKWGFESSRNGTNLYGIQRTPEGWYFPISSSESSTLRAFGLASL